MGQKEIEKEQKKEIEKEKENEKKEENDEHMISILKKENEILKNQLESMNKGKTENNYDTLLAMLEVLSMQRSKILSIKKGKLYYIIKFFTQIENTKTTEEKKSLIKILKDENFRAETKKYTTDSMNRTSTSVLNTSASFISANNHMINNTYDNIAPINNVNSSIKTEKKIVKKKKKIKKKKDGKNSEKIVKSGEIIQKAPGKKIKLLTYKKLYDNPVEENK